MTPTDLYRAVDKLRTLGEDEAADVLEKSVVTPVATCSLLLVQPPGDVRFNVQQRHVIRESIAREVPNMPVLIADSSLRITPLEGYVHSTRVGDYTTTICFKTHDELMEYVEKYTKGDSK